MISSIEAFILMKVILWIFIGLPIVITVSVKMAKKAKNKDKIMKTQHRKRG